MGPTDAFGLKNMSGSYIVDVLSEEIRLSSKKEQNTLFDWLTGIYTYSEDIHTKSLGFSQHTTNQDTAGAAFFAQGTLHIWDALHLTFGGG